MVVVGLDLDLAVATVARLAPEPAAEADARQRAANLRVEPARAGQAIVTALEAGLPQ